jgi:uncharacterized phage protein (TIGR01671 family)
MREIKFRAWDTEMNRWVERGELSIRFNREFDLGKVTPPSVVLMQYTGRKDKNGREIYEGDVVDIRYYGGGHTKDMFTPCVCTFGAINESSDYGNEDNPGFYYRQVGGPNVFSMSSDIHPASEVIGTVHENPELLEGK